jgi:RNA polymerase sigma-70 factor (ECF subfamily)
VNGFIIPPVYRAGGILTTPFLPTKGPKMKRSEKKNIREIKKGNIHAFEVLFKTYYKDLCLYANHYLKDLDLAEEATQDVFFTIWEKRASLHINDSIKAYLYTSIRNKCLKMIRSENIAHKYSNHVKHAGRPKVTTPVDELNAKELNLLIEKTIGQLPERTREIFRMNRYQGLKYQEIADKLSISVKTVEANMGKALKLFRKNLDEYLKVI